MKWTFGIITGPSSPTLNDAIDSINRLKFVDDYEIIVVGGENIDKKNVRHFAFDESVKDMWITRKKNIIAEEAKYENLCMLHDYVALVPGWATSFEKFGSNWDVCMTPVINRDGQRFRDWITNDEWCEEGKLLFLEYSTADRTQDMYVSGTYFCVKKQFLLENKFNEDLCWGEYEDGEWSDRCRKKWNYRCNAKSPVALLKLKQNDHWYDNNNMQIRQKWNMKLN